MAGDLTKKRKLRDGAPLWAKTPHINVVTSKAAASRDYDVIVVGGGISGALVAEAVSDGERSVVVIDRGRPVRGSTVASTAMVQHEIDTPLHKLAKQIGTSKAQRAWRRSVEAVEALTAKVTDLEIVCGFEKKKALYLAGDVLSERGLAKELRAREAADIEARHVSGAALEEVFGIARPAALESDASASCNPAQLTAGLLRAARRRGLEIVAGVEVTDCRELGDQVVVALSSGELIAARFVVFCTGYEFLSSLASKAHSICSTWAIATRPRARLPAWLADYVVWEASDPYLYLRTSWDGRLIVGGEDEYDPDAYRSEAKLASKSARIREKVSDLLGCRVSKPAFTWAAAFGITPTGLPYVDRVPGMNRVFAVMGFGGNGITFSQIASEIIAGAITDKPDPDADLFVFST